MVILSISLSKFNISRNLKHRTVFNSYFAWNYLSTSRKRMFKGYIQKCVVRMNGQREIQDSSNGSELHKWATTNDEARGCFSQWGEPDEHKSGRNQASLSRNTNRGRHLGGGSSHPVYHQLSTGFHAQPCNLLSLTKLYRTQIASPQPCSSLSSSCVHETQSNSSRPE